VKGGLERVCRSGGSLKVQSEDVFAKSDFTPLELQKFRRIVYRYYAAHHRDLPWRTTMDPYRIVVSEIMLQQTQVERVIEKYKQFIKAFPTFSSLAHAPLHHVLTMWQGLGYNRRAIALKKIARIIVEEQKGKVPLSEEELLKLPGIGKYTAAAVLAFAFHHPTVFIETNIRRVFIHFFFRDREGVTDAEISSLVAKTLDYSNPREWYYALMDYGVMLRRENVNPNRRSAHYKRQSPFEGSNRQVRGIILRLLIRNPGILETEILRELKGSPEKIRENLDRLQQEGFIERKGKRFIVAKEEDL